MPITIKPTYEELEQKVKLLEERREKGEQDEKLLHDTEKLYRLLFDHAPDGVVIVDPATACFLDFNETTCLMLGYTREEFSRLSIFDLEADQTPEEIRSRIEYVIQHGISDFETRQRTKQGKIIDVRVTAQYTEVLGKPVYHCIWRDITELRQAREALQKSHDELEIRVQKRTADVVQANKALEAEISERKRAEEKIVILANLSDISPLSITVYDLQDNLLYANQRTFDMHGYSPKEFLALNLKEIDVPSSAAGIEERKKEVLQTGEARFIVEHYRKDGTSFPLEVYLKATKWRGKTVLLSVAADITERQRVEEELKKYREKLEIMVAERTKELEDKTNNLQEINTALNVLLQKREEDRKIMEENFVANIGSLVLPYLEKIRKYNLDEQQQFCLDTVEKNMDEIVTPLLKNIQQFNLTPREVQIAYLIKDGKTTKEIARALGIVEGSIATHRKHIRKKLGLDRTSNLQTHLRFFEK